MFFLEKIPQRKIPTLTIGNAQRSLLKFRVITDYKGKRYIKHSGFSKSCRTRKLLSLRHQQTKDTIETKPTSTSRASNVDR